MKNKLNKLFIFLFVGVLASFLYACTNPTNTKTTPTLTIADASKTYDKEAVTVNYSTNSDGEVTIFYKYQSESDSKYQITAPTDAGEYVVKVFVSESDTYESISQTKEFTISKATPVSGTDYEVPTGLMILSGQKLSTIDLTKYHLTWENGDEVVTSASTFYAKFTPSDLTNYEEVTHIAISVGVAENDVAIPTLAKEFTYDGTEKVVSLSDLVGFDDTQMKVVESSSTFKGINAGTYSIVISLLDSTKYMWSDNTTSDLTLTWEITPIKVTEPVILNTSFDYDGNLKAPTITYDSALITLTGTKDATNAGSYSLTFTFIDSTGNYVWASDESYVPLTFTWKINQVKVALPTVSNTSFVYTGEKLSPTISFDENYVQISTDSVTSAINKGSYSITFVLKDQINYAWEDGTSTAKTYNWAITSESVQIPTLNLSFNFDEEKKEVTTTDITGFDASKMEIVSGESVLSESNVGTYNIVIALKDTNTYVWSDGTTDNKTLTWTIVDNSYGFTLTLVSGTANCYNITKNDTTGEYTINFTTITEDTSYSISGELVGNIVIDVDETETYKFYLILSDVTITSSENSPIVALSGKKFIINADSNTTNSVIDNRLCVTDDSQKSATIYSDVDLNLSGKGTLNVSSTNNNGIHSKDELDIKNETLNVTCVDNALKGNDEVLIESGNITLISTNGDAIKTSNNSLSSKGNQKGDIDITGGTVNVYCASDGIDAAYNANISGEDTVVNIYTTSEYAGSKVATLSSVISGTYYLMVSSSYSYTYSIRFKTSSGYTMVNAETTASKTSGSYKYFAVDTVAGATSFEIYAYTSDQTQGSVSTYYSKSESKSISTSYDTLKITTLSSSSISSSWTLYETTSSGNKDKLVYSSKGIKASNEIIISGGTIIVYAYDDAMHANSDETIESTSSYGAGNVTLSGGTISVKSHDDGVHADGTLTISGATLEVLTSYEGLEGTTISMEAGTATVSATDDGVNGQSTIKVSGGRLDVTVSPSGDTDGIDSNGTIVITGGVVITRGPNSQNACPLDANSTITINGGTVIVIGYAPGSSSGGMGGGGGFHGWGRNPFGPGGQGGSSGISTTLTKTQSSTGLTKGNHTVTISGETISYTNAYSYSGYTTVYASATATIN